MPNSFKKSFREIERVFVCEEEPVLVTPQMFPIAIPLTTLIPPAVAYVDLCSITIPLNTCRKEHSFFLNALINWDMISAANANGAGTAQASFELVRNNDIVVFCVTETIIRPPNVTVAVSSFDIVNLIHLDSFSSCDCTNDTVTYKVRISRVVYNAPTTSVSVGTIVLKAEELKCPQEL